MKNIIVLASLVAVTVISSGCASYLSCAYSKDEIYKERIYASGNKDAIDAVKGGISPTAAIRAIPINGAFGVGIDISNWDALAKHPWRQAGAALLDAGMLYGGYLIYDSQVNDSSSKDGNQDNEGNANVNVNVSNGDGGGNGTTITINTGEQTSEENSDNVTHQ